MNDWTGHVTRTEATLAHKADPADALRFALGEIQTNQPITLTGSHNNMHWHGQLSADRTTWWVMCQFGFRLGGTATRDATGYALAGDVTHQPKVLQLPGEDYPEWGEKVAAG